MASHQKHAESENNATSNPNRRVRRAGLATVVAASAALALAACAPSNVNATPEPVETSTSAPAPEFEGASPEDFIIPAGLDAETVAEAVVAGSLTDWGNAGANDSLWDRILASDKSNSEVNAEVAAENKVIVTDNLFIKGWEEDASLAGIADTFEQGNFGNLEWYSATAWSDEEPENIEGFRAWMDVTAVREVDDGDGDPNTRTIKVDYTDHTNSDKNVGPDPQRAGGTLEIDLVSDGTQDRLSRVEFIV